MESTAAHKPDAGPAQTSGAGPPDFWAQFRMFPDPWMPAIYRKTVFLIGIPALPLLLLLILAAGQDLRSPYPGWTYTQSALGEWQEIASILGLIAIAFAYRSFLDKVEPFFRWILMHRVEPAPSQAGRDRVAGFLNDFQAGLFSRRGQWISVWIAVAVVAVFNLMAGIPARISFYWNMVDPPDRLFALGLFIVWVFGFGLWGVYTAFAAHAMYVIAKHLSLLTAQFQLRIQPAHPDSCGGLKPLGDFCFAIALPIVICGLVAVFFSLGRTFFAELIIGPVAFREIMPETVRFINGLLLLVISPFSLAVFILPIWQVHGHMASFNYQRMDKYADRVSKLEGRLLALLQEGGNLADAKVAVQKLDILRSLNPGEAGSPVWPFRWVTLAKIVSPILVNTGGMIIERFLSIAISYF